MLILINFMTYLCCLMLAGDNEHFREARSTCNR